MSVFQHLYRLQCLLAEWIANHFPWYVRFVAGKQFGQRPVQPANLGRPYCKQLRLIRWLMPLEQAADGILQQLPVIAGELVVGSAHQVRLPRNGRPGTSSSPLMTFSAIAIFLSMSAPIPMTIRCACGDPAPCMASTRVVTDVIASM